MGERQTRCAQAPPKTYSTRPLRLLFTVGAIIASLAVGLLFNGLWRAYLLANNGVPFDLADPIFGLDVSFYIFELPWLEALLSRAKILVALTTIGVAVRYALFGQIKSRASTSHLSILGAVWMILVGLGWILNRYALLQSDLGVVFGAGYTDINARMPLYIIEAIVFFAAAAILLLNVFIRRWRLLIITGISWLALSAIGPAYPATVQQFTVEPNEFIVEKPYIENNIHYTRYAYGLDKIKEQEYSATGTITADDITANGDALSNVRLWDYRPMLRTYGQLQEIRLYYTFNEVDIDRYTIDGDLRQVMLSARELDVDELAEQAQTWINRHMIFTHGYGLALSPVSDVGEEGLPSLLVRDIPPVSAVPELEITRPEIYFGESTHNYVIINAAEDEFDYPEGDVNAYTRYDGPDGVPVGGFFRRLLLATRFNSTQLFLSPAISRDSRILFHRTLTDRVNTIAPMLWFDDDPYPVITDVGDGETGIVWLLDAYTWTDHFPYSEPVGGINYIRNSVKIAIDAYTGETTFYLIDPDDPIAATYARIFPDLFQPVESMPADLRAATGAIPKRSSSTSRASTPPTTCAIRRSSTTARICGTSRKNSSRPASSRWNPTTSRCASLVLTGLQLRRTGVYADPALRPQAEAEHGRLALRRLRRRGLRRTRYRQTQQRSPRLRPVANRGPRRSGPRHLAAAFAVESARLPRTARQPAGAPHRRHLPLHRTALPRSGIGPAPATHAHHRRLQRQSRDGGNTRRSADASPQRHDSRTATAPRPARRPKATSNRWPPKPGNATRPPKPASKPAIGCAMARSRRCLRIF